VLFQRMKTHPLFRKYLEGGEMVEWGAKTIPEGGYFALPQRRHGDGVVMLGDAAGFVDVPSLKGIHYAVQSGILAARAIFQGLKDGSAGSETATVDTATVDTAADSAGADDAPATLPASVLRRYDEMVDGSFITADMKRTRNMRLAFKDGFYMGGVKASLMTLTGGAFPGGKIDMEADAAAPKEPADGDGSGAGAPFAPDGKLTFSKVDAVFKAGNQTRDDIPSHLVVGEDIPPEVAEMYARLCPAGVYELTDDGRLVVNAPNCIDCKATDVLGPRWTPREGGSGPRYRRM
ncbi:MAG TPA: 4Fe-4S dicluster domain-containing protein, partial [Longimicrobiales bacterium]|nr:4Fe-4S dicluster domain-containing protein [Longimicrobiales bacterium]